MASPRLLGDWMRRRRAELDLTQERLAEQVGCAVDTIRALEHGRRRASPPMADRLATVLQIPRAERTTFLAAARAAVQLPSASGGPATHRTTARGAGQAAPVQAPALLATKLYPPHQPRGVIIRSRLIERLDQGLTGPLTLVSAPAGFGKTTLVAHRLAQLVVPSAWLGLDAHDDVPATFLRYVVTALRGIDPAIGAQLVPLLDLADTVLPQTVISTLLNDVAALGRDIVLVLDDLHVLTHPALYAALAYLLDHLPPRLHLVLLTREDPPLPLARLRARHQLVELRAADLRFNRAEAAAFLQGAMHLSLDADAIAALVGRTEGWIVGLQLAALSLRDVAREDVATAIAAFTGNHRYVVDYLVDEVLRAQPAHLQHFLLQTALLERLCGPLCDALLLGHASRASPMPETPSAAYSQAILEALERANLFVVPLDSVRHWYRYHHLFADVLQTRLVSGAAPAQIRQLRQRASAWCETAGLLAEAVQYALAAHDWERVVRLLEQRGTDYALYGHIEAVLGWLDALPDERVRARPALCLLHAGLLLSTHQFERAAARLDWVEQGIPSIMATPHASSLVAQLAALRSTLTRFAGDLAASVALGHEALQHLHGGRSNPAAIISVGHAFLVHGDVGTAAEQHLATLLADLHATDRPAILLRRSLLWAWMRVLQGRLREAERVYRSAPELSAGNEQGLALIVGGAAYYFGLGALLHEWNDLDAATALLEQGMTLARGRLSIEPDILLMGVVALARVQHARGQATAARATLHEYWQLTQGCTVAADLTARVAAMEAHFTLMDGDLPRAGQWAETVDVSATAELSYLREWEYVTLARVRLAQGRADPAGAYLHDALQLLDRLLTRAQRCARRSSMIPLLILRAGALAAQGSRREALNTLERTLGLAAPEDYVRVFVDEGAPLAALLREVADRASPMAGYAATLLAAFPEAQGAARRAQHTAPIAVRSPLARSPAVVEPLTERELEILQLIAAGLSNQAIADRLIIALSTVKRHINNLYGKLAVQSRTQALLRARELQLL